MSNAMTPNQAPELTSLAATDRLLATDANGSIRRISRDNLVALTKKGNASSPQWIRLFEYTGSYVFFQLASNFFNNPGNSILVHAILLRDSLDYSHIEILSHLKHVGNYVFQKMRIVQKDKYSPAYLDVYYSSDKYNNIYLSIFPGVSMPTPLLENNAEIPAGYSTKEFGMTVRGGVNHYASISYKLPLHEQKGGRRNEQRDNDTGLSEESVLRLLFGQPLDHCHGQRRQSGESLEAVYNELSDEYPDQLCDRPERSHIPGAVSARRSAQRAERSGRDGLVCRYTRGLRSIRYGYTISADFKPKRSAGNQGALQRPMVTLAHPAVASNRKEVVAA